jgi:hypothetical protein
MSLRPVLALVICTACHKETVEAPDAAIIANDNISGTITERATWSGTIHIARTPFLHALRATGP